MLRKIIMWVGENLNVLGNLNVFGNFTRLNTTNIVIDDPLIHLGKMLLLINTLDF